MKCRFLRQGAVLYGVLSTAALVLLDGTANADDTKASLVAVPEIENDGAIRLLSAVSASSTKKRASTGKKRSGNRDKKKKKRGKTSIMDPTPKAGSTIQCMNGCILQAVVRNSKDLAIESVLFFLKKTQDPLFEPISGEVFESYPAESATADGLYEVMLPAGLEAGAYEWKVEAVDVHNNKVTIPAMEFVVEPPPRKCQLECNVSPLLF